MIYHFTHKIDIHHGSSTRGGEAGHSDLDVGAGGDGGGWISLQVDEHFRVVCLEKVGDRVLLESDGSLHGGGGQGRGSKGSADGREEAGGGDADALHGSPGGGGGVDGLVGVAVHGVHHGIVHRILVVRRGVGIRVELGRGQRGGHQREQEQPEMAY